MGNKSSKKTDSESKKREQKVSRSASNGKDNWNELNGEERF